MKVFTSKRQQSGRLGETIAVGYLEKIGYSIIEQNYTKKTGEIDIVAAKNGVLHFVEVKTLIKPVSYETGGADQEVSRETYSPFENVSRAKLRKFSRTCEWYVWEKRVSRDTKWQIDVIAVTVTRETRSAKVEVMWNVIC